MDCKKMLQTTKSRFRQKFLGQSIARIKILMQKIQTMKKLTKIN